MQENNEIIYTNTGEPFATLLVKPSMTDEEIDGLWDYTHLRAFITHDIDTPLQTLLALHYELRNRNLINLPYNHNLKQALISRTLRTKAMAYSDDELSELVSLLKKLMDIKWTSVKTPIIAVTFEESRKSFRACLAQAIIEQRAMYTVEERKKEQAQRRYLIKEIRKRLGIAPSDDTTPYALKTTSQLRSRLTSLKQKANEELERKAFLVRKPKPVKNKLKTSKLLEGLQTINLLGNSDIEIFID